MALSWHFDAKDHPNYWLDENIMQPTEDGRGEQHDGVGYRLTPMAETLVLLTMPCGMQKVTKDNADEFFVRLKVLEAVNGGAFFRDGEGNEVFMQPEIVYAMVGLYVNVPQESHASFRKRIINQHVEDCRRTFRRAIKKLEQEQEVTA